MEERAFFKRMPSLPYPLYGWTQEWLQTLYPMCSLRPDLARLSTHQYAMSKDLCAVGPYLHACQVCIVSGTSM